MVNTEMRGHQVEKENPIHATVQGTDFFACTNCDDHAGRTALELRETYEMICIVKGIADYWIEDQHYTLRKGDILLIRKDVKFVSNLKPKYCPYERHIIWLNESHMKSIKAHDINADYCFSKARENHTYLLSLSDKQFDKLQEEFVAMVLECSTNSFNANLSSKAILVSLLVQINRMVLQNEQILKKGNPNRLTPVLQYINDKCSEQLTIDSIAKQFAYSSSHLAHSFKEHIGTSLYQYILMRRLQKGRDLILSGASIKKTYTNCGFNDYAGFYRAFLKEYGLSPQQYKKREL